MCKWNDIKPLEVLIPANISYTGVARIKVVNIDKCIYSIVKALNDNGITTIASCCGHENIPGNIMLSDGRELIISPDFETSRFIEKQFKKNIHGEIME